MTAAEARELAEDNYDINHTQFVLGLIKAAAKLGQFSVKVDPVYLTDTTCFALYELGYTTRSYPSHSEEWVEVVWKPVETVLNQLEKQR